MSSIELTNGSATLTPRAEYLLVVEHGTLSMLDEVNRYTNELEAAATRFELRRLLVDARSETTDTAGHAEARAAMWRWMKSQRAFEMIGFVLVDPMMIARVNMTALAEKLPVRAFDAVAEGHRWLARRGRLSTATGIAVQPGTPSPVPPAPTTPSSGSARQSSTHRLRPTLGAKTEEGDAFASENEHARQTVKVAAMDDATAERKLRGG
jgi:hypothetical protein